MCEVPDSMNRVDEPEPDERSNPLETTVSCKKCGKDWIYKSEQAACTEKFGECIVCRKHILTGKELEIIMKEADKRGAYSN